MYKSQVHDIVSQAQDVQFRISHLPTTMLSEDEHVRMADLPRKAFEIRALETELEEANREYIQSLDEARMFISLTHDRCAIFEARYPTRPPHPGAPSGARASQP